MSVKSYLGFKKKNKNLDMGLVSVMVLIPGLVTIPLCPLLCTWCNLPAQKNSAIMTNDSGFLLRSI